MVKEILYFSAVLTNLTDLQPKGGRNDPNLPIYFKLKCFNCGTTSTRDSCVMYSVTTPKSNGKGIVHLEKRCEGCQRRGTVALVHANGSPLTFAMSTAGEYTALIGLQYASLEPIDISFGNGWKAVSVMGDDFYSVDLSGGSFAEIRGNVWAAVNDVRCDLRRVG